ncbi:unnamed protein product [Litomosoides sigmodontis]|uniref:G-protein coupled receptors family 1 profile domain-containing protein n=1 Tax=Litomosoides sigmodontis TaxID=42156 RepID=A0A3P6TGH7_LITSI|nr:unnamed protein product [Litomosoides sigmodontis]
MTLKFSIYIAGGIVTFTLNIFYFVAIVRTKTNRERYGLTGMEFFADGLTGFAIALTGAMRNIQILLGSQNYTVSRLFCVIMPYNIILAWTEPMTAISMLVVSIDRLISIVKPVLYYRKMLNIQHYLVRLIHHVQIFGSNLVVFLMISSSVVCSYLNNIRVHPFCWTPNSRCVIFNQLFYGTRISAATGSVTLYVLTLFIVRRYNRRMKEQQNTQTANLNKRQLNFTKTVGLSCFATAGLYVAPMIAAFTQTNNDMIQDSIYSTAVIISFLNSFSKTIILGCGSHEIREAIIDVMPGIFSRCGIHKAQTTKVIKFNARQVAPKLATNNGI